LCASIKPDIEVEEVPTYLIEHIELDLNMIQTALGKNKDDVLVLIHYILSQMMDLQTLAVIIKVVTFIGGGNRSTWRKATTHRKALTIKFISVPLYHVSK
jgi:hypothetical protein